MNVLVAGGTGFVGRHLCAELADRGHDVTALSRSPDDASLPDGVDAVAGDVTEYDDVAPAFEGRDAVVNLVALSALFEPPDDLTHEEVHLGGTENVVEAAETHDVERLVQMSALGADPDGPTAYIRAKGQAEQVVRESDLDWVVVRPSVVFGEGAEFVPFTKTVTTPYVTGLPGGGERTRFQPIWVEDLAPMLADCVESDEHAGRTYELGGPEVLTLADVTELAYRAEGKPVTVLPVPMVLARVGLTVAGVIPFVPMGPDQYRSLKFDNTTVENDIDAFGVSDEELTTLGEFLGVA